ncbi:Uncharacterized zinc-type alcohol dehydrogenase-like protein YcjQ [Seminavis robusta]|uniref:Uncharacterized zinc-type alcohol dehydrogenase-like protein YcjQ n=1 Tax=Seminavis robusta TaxID=568900 RepID=A0A9N8H465_9STRA|nr:Uncharacterized zinc-type alcohol dehydrogenase-like protein YcjQ [Seminavis robusta]|eukprot:Sro54_g031960.1 Uncharacterized zinc-type alcohol dehydrogenase-like protein YcjQ (996) ;mRNA; r:89264-92336
MSLCARCQSCLLQGLVLATLLLRSSGISRGGPSKGDVLLVLDVDNTLYDEGALRKLSLSPLGIEEQIVQNIHSYCREHVGMSKDEADRFHHEYGSTIEGLRTLWAGNLKTLEDNMKQCYQAIWPPSMDYTALLQLHQPSSQSLTTGYSHSDDSARQLAQLRSLLQRIPYPLYLASNSPSWHVRTVLQALGMLNVPWSGLTTPDQSRRGVDGDTTYTIYTTKHSPSIFFRDILKQHNQEKSDQSKLLLLDDSKKNIECLPPQLMTGIRVSSDNPLSTALLQAVGVIDMNTESYEFSQVQYLQSKNVVDARSIHRPTWLRVADELRAMLQTTPTAELEIVDVGAGLLSMFKLVVEGGNDNQLPSLVDQVSNGENAIFKGIRYFAYEPNQGLQSQCMQVLQDMGFTRQTGQEQDEEETVFVGSRKGCTITVHLRLYDYNQEQNSKLTIIHPTPHIVAGCCFADLLDPNQLVASLLLRFLSRTQENRPDSCLCYFPITFQGVTQFVPPKPFEIHAGRAQSVPSDTVAFALYSKALEEIHGHNLDPHKLEDAMKAFGGSLLSSGASKWDIDPQQHPYLWQTLLYFFERVAGPELIKTGWDAAGWLQRARSPGQPSILVSNVDLLFRLPRMGNAKIASVDANGDEHLDDSLEQQETGMEEIQFTAPYKVTTVTKLGADLQPHQVQIKSEYSLISSGTELKVFKGMFDDAALDVNIKGMEEERMAYPLAYGYSLVGRVVQCGSQVEDADQLLGRLVFTFSAHATHVIADRDAIQLVPEGIAAEDAIFMPSVETALSIVHDAHVRLGEKVAVFGQGLIGLLVTSILCNSQQQDMVLQAPCCSDLGTKVGTVTTIDAIPARLGASAAMGASQALLPSEVPASGPFDVAIEVSGNARALQSSIEHTSNNGRVVIASWYGNADVTLKLGIDFHRSHKTIVTSQVSEIKAELSGLWTKQRRFALTWELVKQIRPSRLITMQTGLEHAQKAYEALDQGSEIAVAFRYG